MTPDQQKHVTSLELSQKLKVAGFPQDGTLFVWVNGGDGGISIEIGSRRSILKGWNCLSREHIFSVEWMFPWCAAPIATEIRLPYAVDDEKHSYYLTIFPVNKERLVISYEESTWVTETESFRILDFISHTVISTEPDSRAEMWLTLNERGLTP